jgi:hypothetical protein
LNIYDLLYHEKLVLSQAAAEELNQLLDPKKQKGEQGENEAAGGTKVGADEEAA